MASHLFTYGSLMFPEVMELLTGKHYAFEDVRLWDFERRALNGKSYPGLFEVASMAVDGRLYFDLDDASVEILDIFEDEIYERRTVRVCSKERGEVEARAYVIPSQLACLGAESWDPAQFRVEHLDRYLVMCERFRLQNVRR